MIGAVPCQFNKWQWLPIIFSLHRAPRTRRDGSWRRRRLPGYTSSDQRWSQVRHVTMAAKLKDNEDFIILDQYHLMIACSGFSFMNRSNGCYWCVTNHWHYGLLSYTPLHLWFFKPLVCREAWAGFLACWLRSGRLRGKKRCTGP